MKIPPGHALVIADGRMTIVPLAEIERLKRGDTGIPDTPIASITVPESQLDEALAKVLRALSENNDKE
jgi:hypothetical protein